MTTMHNRKPHSKSKAAKIRAMLKKDMTPAYIAEKLKVAINYVYIIKGQMKRDGLVRVFPPTDPLSMPVPTSSGKRGPGRPPKKRIEPILEPLSVPLPVWNPPAEEPRKLTLIERLRNLLKGF